MGPGGPWHSSICGPATPSTCHTRRSHRALLVTGWLIADVASLLWVQVSQRNLRAQRLHCVHLLQRQQQAGLQAEWTDVHGEHSCPCVRRASAVARSALATAPAPALANRRLSLPHRPCPAPPAVFKPRHGALPRRHLFRRRLSGLRQHMRQQPAVLLRCQLHVRQENRRLRRNGRPGVHKPSLHQVGPLLWRHLDVSAPQCGRWRMGRAGLACMAWRAAASAVALPRVATCTAGVGMVAALGDCARLTQQSAPRPASMPPAGRRPTSHTRTPPAPGGAASSACGSGQPCQRRLASALFPALAQHQIRAASPLVSCLPHLFHHICIACLSSWLCMSSNPLPRTLPMPPDSGRTTEPTPAPLIPGAQQLTSLLLLLSRHAP